MVDQLRVLIVDDNELNLFVLQEYLSLLDCVVFSAKNATEAIGIIEANVLDVVITDLNMPEFDGYQLAELVMAHDRRILIYATSANAHQSQFLKTRALGFTDYLVKPIHRATIANLVDSINNTKKTSSWPALPRECADVFRRMVSEHLFALGTIDQNEDINALRHWVHHLSGGVAVVGDTELLDLCYALQDSLECTLKMTPHGEALLAIIRSQLIAIDGEGHTK